MKIAQDTARFSFLMAAAFASAPAYAQGDSRDKILERLEMLQAQVADLRAELIQMKAAPNSQVNTAQAEPPRVEGAALPEAITPPLQPVAAAQGREEIQWTGFYAGLVGGYNKGRYSDALPCSETKVGAASAFSGQGVASLCEGYIVAISGLAPGSDQAGWRSTPDADKSSGAYYGLKLGFNKQLGRFVLGAETELVFSNMHGGGQVILTAGDFSGNAYEVRHRIDWSNRAVVKAGYLLVDRLLISANGGAALVHSSLSSSAGYSDGGTRIGWTLGAEAEYRFTNSLGIFAKYNRQMIDGVNYQGSSFIGLIDNFHRYDIKIDQFGAGVNYHF